MRGLMIGLSFLFLSGSPAPADQTPSIPDGTYVLVTPLAVDESFGAYLHLTVAGRQFHFTVGPIEMLCLPGFCKDKVVAFDLNLALTRKNRIALMGLSRINGAGETVAEPGGYIEAFIEATTTALTGARPVVVENGVDFTKGRTITSFRAADLDRALELWYFETYLGRIYDDNASIFKTCITRQLLEHDAPGAASGDRKIALLAIAPFAKMARLSAEALIRRRAEVIKGRNHYQDRDRKADLLELKSHILGAAIFENVETWEDLPTEFFEDSYSGQLLPASDADLAALFEELTRGREEEIAAARSYWQSLEAHIFPLRTATAIQRLCNSIALPPATGG